MCSWPSRQDEERPEVDLTLQAVSAVLREVDLTTVESRLYALQELCRVGGAAEVAARFIAHSPRVVVVDQCPDHCHHDLQSGATKTNRSGAGRGLRINDPNFWEGIYGWLIEFFGFRMRGPRPFVSSLLPSPR